MTDPAMTKPAAESREAAIRIVDEWTGEVLKRGFASSWHYGELIDALRAPAGDAGMREARELIAKMAFAMQVAQLALQSVKRDDSLEAALSSLTIALQMEADHWQKTALRAPAGDAGVREALGKIISEWDRFEKYELQLDEGFEQAIDAARPLALAPREAEPVGRCSPGSESEPGRYVHIDNVVYHLDDIEVDKAGKCSWTDVANALTCIKLCIEPAGAAQRAVDGRASADRALQVLKFIFESEDGLSQESIDEIAMILDDAGISTVTSTEGR